MVSKEIEKERLETSIVKSGNVPGIFHTRDELIHLEPVLEGSSIFGGFVHEKGFVINANSYIDALICEATRRGVSLRLGDAACAVEEERPGHNGSHKYKFITWSLVCVSCWSLVRQYCWVTFPTYISTTGTNACCHSTTSLS